MYFKNKRALLPHWSTADTLAVIVIWGISACLEDILGFWEHCWLLMQTQEVFLCSNQKGVVTLPATNIIKTVQISVHSVDDNTQSWPYAHRFYQTFFTQFKVLVTCSGSSFRALVKRYSWEAILNLFVPLVWTSFFFLPFLWTDLSDYVFSVFLRTCATALTCRNS